jgi:hypothetical protein
VSVDYLTFSALFIVSHIVAYFFAGAVTYPLFYKPLHGGEGSLYGAFLRDMNDPSEARRQMALLVPAQVVRGLLMALVLLPVLGFLGEQSFAIQFAFMAGLMFVYTDLGAAVPFSNTIEGIVYMKPRFIREAFVKTQVESILYSVTMGLAAAWFLF